MLDQPSQTMKTQAPKMPTDHGTLMIRNTFNKEQKVEVTARARAAVAITAGAKARAATLTLTQTHPLTTMPRFKLEPAMD